jgi:hypothetical protein
VISLASIYNNSMKDKLYNEAFIKRLYDNQIEHGWDLEKDFHWLGGINHDKFFAPLDQNALLLPGASVTERKVISQVLGLVIASAIYELEESLLRLKGKTWNQDIKRFPVNPEFEAWGELFYTEEIKHSLSFKRYVEMFAEDVGVSYKDLQQILPVVENSKAEKCIDYLCRSGSYSYWWLAIIVEQEFLHMFRLMESFKSTMDPLYYDLHFKHYEEERRHASFPYFMLELLFDRDQRLLSKVHQKMDLALCQSLMATWTIGSLQKLENAKKLKDKHPFFADLTRIIATYDKNSWVEIIWKLFTQSPYISSLIHPRSHKAVENLAKQKDSFLLNFPSLNEEKLTTY